MSYMKEYAHHGCPRDGRSTSDSAKNQPNSSTETLWLALSMAFVLSALLILPRLMCAAHMAGWF